MVWGAAGTTGVDDLIRRLDANDPKLTSLHLLKHRRLGAKEVAALSKSLERNSSLTELSASCHAISPEACATLATMLTHNSTLRTLSVGDSTLGDVGVAALAPGLQTNRGLTHLDLEHKTLGVAGASTLAQVLSANSMLQRLTLARNAFGDQGIEALCRDAGSVAPWQQLRHLDLQACGLSHQGISILASAGGICRLESLKLGHNDLEASGADVAAASQALAGLVAAASKLQELDLQSTSIGDAAGKALAAVLPSSSLTTLDLSHCRLGESTGHALAAALRGGALLRDLRLARGGDLTDSAIAAVAQALVHAPSLTSLDLAGTQAGVATIEALARTPCLEVLSLFNCCLPGAPAVLLAAALTPASATQQTAASPGTGLSSNDDPAAAAKEQSPATCMDALGTPGKDASAATCIVANGGAAFEAASDRGAASVGASHSSPVAAMATCSSSGGFCKLRELNISACGLHLAEIQAMLDGLAAGGAPNLKSVEMGVNPATEDLAMHGLVERLRAVRPTLQLHWRSGDDAKAAEEAKTAAAASIAA